jgi:prepilin-type N-terminal cleavage/methylation domain-containing protein
MKIFRNKKEFLGFTLAEVLITLGIIGVVAALTMPTLIQNHQKKVYLTELHKVYNEISQAAELYINNNNVVDLSESRLRNNPEELRNFLTSYLKVTKDCGTLLVPCFATEYKAVTGNQVRNIKNVQCNVVVAIASGASICADAAAMADTDDGEGGVNSSSNTAGNDGDIVAFEVDINGKQGPNRYGKDYFSFQLDKNGVVYDKFYVRNGNSAILNADHPDNGTFGKIVNDGWQMNY